MPTPTALWLKRPLMTFICVLNGAIGSRQRPSSMSAPEPLAHQFGKFTPHAMNSAANRFGAGAPAPQTGRDSSQGRVMVTPMPRRNRRRDISNRRCSGVLGLGVCIKSPCGSRRKEALTGKFQIPSSKFQIEGGAHPSASLELGTWNLELQLHIDLILRHVFARSFH